MLKKVRRFYIIDEEREYVLGRVSGIINSVTLGRDHYASTSGTYDRGDGVSHAVRIFSAKCTKRQAKKILKLTKTYGVKCLNEC